MASIIHSFLDFYRTYIFLPQIAHLDTSVSYFGSIFFTIDTIGFHCVYIVYFTVFSGFLISFFILLYSFNKLFTETIATRNSLETRAELAVLRIYVENQAILELILLYRASKCKQTKEQGSEDYLWTHTFTFL